MEPDVTRPNAPIAPPSPWMPPETAGEPPSFTSPTFPAPSFAAPSAPTPGGPPWQPTSPPNPSAVPPVAPPPSSWGAAPTTYPPVPPSNGPGTPTRSGASGGGAGRTARTLAAAAAVFVAGVGGVLVGANLADEQAPISASGSDRNEISASATTVAGPVEAGADEPIAAVASVLAPAVVQIETSSGLGSGFIYDADGLILTAAHVVEGAGNVTVRFADGRRVEGTVVGGDSTTDVAVVSVAGVEDLPVAVLALGVDLQVGQTAVAIGSPFGLDQTVTAGIVSAIGRATETTGSNGVARAIPAIQTDAPINSGNSGGALADRQGRVIGVNSSIITADEASTGNVGVGFAIPIDIAKAVADRLVEGSSARSGYMGVSSADATGSTVGAEIQQVESGSPADAAGVQVGDVVVAFDGSPVGSAIDLVAAVTPREPGDDITLSVLRGSEELSITITLGEATR